MWWVLLCAVARAGDASEAVAEPAASPDTAEYNRLSQELERLSTKNAWVGVERTFRELVATHVDPSFNDWYRGAQAARALGDIGEAYSRLREAARLQGEQAIVDWLAEIDHRYGRVFLACDPGSHIVLQSDALPFDPDQRRAIEYAQAQIREQCLFEGRLPAGRYRFFEQDLDVLPMVQTLHVDLRGIEIDRKTRKALRKQWSASATET